MKKNYFLVHGSFGNPYVNWFEYIFKEIEKIFVFFVKIVGVGPEVWVRAFFFVR